MATRRHLRNGALAVILAGLLWSALPGPTPDVVQRERLSQEPADALIITAEVAEPMDLSLAADPDLGATSASGPASGGMPGFVTTEEPLAATPAILPPDPVVGAPSVFPPHTGGTTPPTVAGPSSRGGGSGLPGASGPGSSTPRPTSGTPGNSGPLYAGPVGGGTAGPASSGPGSSSPDTGPAVSGPGSNTPPSMGPAAPVASLPASPAGNDDPGDRGPASGEPAAPIAAGPGTPPGVPAPVDLPGGSADPVIAATNGPGDDWFSPGHSPGIAEIDGDFTLGGGSLLFEILGTVAGVGYDQLQVDGHVDLDSGDVVFAFIGGFVPDDPNLIFDLILADSLAVNLDAVNFYYGFFDPAVDPTWALHAPRDLSLYTVWDPSSGITRIIDQGETGNGSLVDGRLAIQYNPQNVSTAATPQQGPDRVIVPLQIGAAIPAPASLLLLATGLLLSGAARRGRRAN